MARPRKFEEEGVLRAARDAFWRNGYAATSLDDLTAATGLGKGSLDGAFGDKRRLFGRVFDDYCARSVAGMREQLAGDDAGARERIRALLRGNVAAMTQDPERRGCLVAKTAAELGGCDRDIAARARANYDEMEALFADCVRQAQRHGDIRPDADPRRVGAFLLAVLRGIEALYKAGADGETLLGVADTAVDAL